MHEVKFFEIWSTNTSGCGELVTLIQKSTQCFKPFPEMNMPPEPSREQLFEGFHNPNMDESEEEGEEEGGLGPHE